MNSLTPVNSLNSYPCSLSAWIAPSHGFVQFACGTNMSSTIGFGPRGNKYAAVGALIGLSYPGTLTYDSQYRELCESKKISCLVSRLETTPDTIEKAWLEKEAILLETASLRKKFDSTKPSVYRLWNNNCLHFMSRIMDSTGITDWRKTITYSSPPSISDTTLNYAWHYFRSMQIYKNWLE